MIAGQLRCSPALGLLLTDPARETAEVVRQIATRPELKGEAEYVVAVLDQALRVDADALRLGDLLAMNGIAFGLDATDHPPEWWAAKWKPYIDALAGFPVACVERAFAMWNAPTEHGLDARQSTFYPKPADLHTLATKAKEELWRARWRAKKATEDARPARIAHRQRMTKAEMIAAGYMDADGHIIGLGSGPKAMPTEFPRPVGDQHAIAERIRRAGVPINRRHIGPEEEAIG